MQIILASTSKYRAQQLSQLLEKFDQVAPDVDESSFKREQIEPRDLAIRLAWAKAIAVSEKYPDALIIAGDQVGEVEGHILEKPGTMENAIAQLKLMNGKTHQLHSAIVVLNKNKNISHEICETTKLSMRYLSENQIIKYVGLDTPTDCAGSYKIESKGISLFHTIETQDQTAIVGIPLLKLSQKLFELNLLLQ